MEDAELRNILFSIQGSIAGFQNDMSDVKNDIADMKTDIANMKTDITNMKSDIVQLRGSVKSIELKLENEIWSYVKKKYKLNTTNFLFLCNC